MKKYNLICCLYCHVLRSNVDVQMTDVLIKGARNIYRIIAVFGACVGLRSDDSRKPRVLRNN